MQFERRTHTRLIEFYGEGVASHDATKVVTFLRYLEQTILPAHSTARARVMLYSDERVDVPAPSGMSSVTQAIRSARTGQTYEVGAIRGD